MSSQNLKISPHCDAQFRFLTSETKYLAAIAGLGGGKTHAGAEKALVMCLQNPGIRGCVTAPSYKMLRDATIPKYEELFNKIENFAQFLGGDSPMARLRDGGEILFRSTEKPDYLRGGEYGFVHMDEAAQSPHYAFQILQGRLRQRKKDNTFYPLQMWITTTPSGLNWIYTEFIMQERPDFEVASWSTKDNIYLPPEYYNELLRQYSGKFGSQELEGKFLVMQGDCMFDVNNLERILKYDCTMPKEMFEHGFVSMWKEPVIGVKYVMAADCADRGGGGMNCAVIIDQFGEECLEIWGEIPMDKFAQLIDQFGREYNRALVGVEVNGTAGGYIVKTLRTLGYPKLYRRGKDEDDVGWYTSAFNREVILQSYRTAVDRNQTKIHNAEAVKEMRTFVSKPSGKWEHLEGCFDDRVMTRAIAWRMKDEKQGFGTIISSVKRLVTTC